MAPELAGGEVAVQQQTRISPRQVPRLYGWLHRLTGRDTFTHPALQCLYGG